MKPRIYTDTSVLGGCEDHEFREPSLRLLEAFQRGELILVLSEVTVRELETAPEGVRAVLGRVPDVHIEALVLSPEAEDLAAAYITDGAIGARMRADALHIALATIARVDVLVSWNFKHIVNLRRIHAYNASTSREVTRFSRFERPGRYQAMSEPSSKTFDCVQSMREVRDRLSAEMEGKSYDELVEWLRGHRYKDPLLQGLAEKAAQQADQRTGLRPAADRQRVRRHMTLGIMVP